LVIKTGILLGAVTACELQRQAVDLLSVLIPAKLNHCCCHHEHASCYLECSCREMRHPLYQEGTKLCKLQVIGISKLIGQVNDS